MVHNNCCLHLKTLFSKLKKWYVNIMIDGSNISRKVGGKLLRTIKRKKNSYSSSMRDLLCEKIEEGQGVCGCHISISAWRKYLSSFLVHSYMCYLSILFRKERHKERYAKILCCIRFTTTMLRVLYEKIYSNKTFSWGCVRQRLSCVMLKGFEEIAPVVCKVITHMCNSQSSIHCWFDLELPVTPRVLVGEVAGT